MEVHGTGHAPEVDEHLCVDEEEAPPTRTLQLWGQSLLTARCTGLRTLDAFFMNQEHSCSAVSSLRRAAN